MTETKENYKFRNGSDYYAHYLRKYPEAEIRPMRGPNSKQLKEIARELDLTPSHIDECIDYWLNN